ncbi:MAG: 50S ribosomal protein L24 [Propionibacteriaceae bacterium]|nr:50S ribosomal protein L24 [Propionibacteriaceae bacterium]
MTNHLHVKKGDRVKVIAGHRDDRGKVSEVLKVFPKDDMVIVEGVNVVKKHTPAQQTQSGGTAGGIIETEAPIHVSNVQLVVTVDGKEVPTRVGYERREVTKRRPDGTEYTAERSIRIARKTGKEI